MGTDLTEQDDRAADELLPPAVVGRLTREIADALADAVDATLEEHNRERSEVEVTARLAGFQAGLAAAYGFPMASAVFDELSGKHVCRIELARQRGVSRAAVSKVLCRVRRNLGFEPKYPLMRRGGAKPKGESVPG
jgi:hypothetical protein